jgi:two-component system sensor histidine kinase RegB
VSNPFIYLFLLQGILGAVLLPAVRLGHGGHHRRLCGGAGVLLPAAAGGAGGGLPNLYTLGVLICFALTSILMVVSSPAW